MATYLGDAVERMALIYEYILQPPTIRRATVYRYFPIVSEQLPYLTLRIAADSVTEQGQDIRLDLHTVIARLVLGHNTEGIDGEVLMSQFEVVPAVKNTFQQSEMLRNSAAGTTAQPFLVDTQAYAPSSTGIRYFLDSGIGNPVIGIEFIHTLQFARR